MQAAIGVAGLINDTGFVNTTRGNRDRGYREFTRTFTFDHALSAEERSKLRSQFPRLEVAPSYGAKEFALCFTQDSTD